MAANAKPVSNNTINASLHIKILYILLSLLAVISVTALSLCFTEIYALRTDFEGKIVRRGTAEFEDLDAAYQARKHGDRGDALTRGELGEDGEIVQQGTRNRRSAFPYDAAKMDRGEKEGSGGADDWVWLTSYSRIPVSRSLLYGLSSNDFSCDLMKIQLYVNQDIPEFHKTDQY